MSIFDEGYRGKSVFKDQSKLGFDYVPKELPHRDGQIQRVFSIFRPVVESNMAATAMFTGSVGTGKTVLSKLFCKEFKEFAQRKGRNLDYVFVNCRQRKTDDAVLLKILNHFAFFPERGFNYAEKITTLRRHLDKDKTHLIVVLDEVDVLIKKKTELIYTLSRFDEEREGPRKSLSLILISQKYVLDMLDPASLSTFKRSNVLEFAKYSERELYDIVNQRAEMAFHPTTVPDESVMLISDIASERGDARFALELLEKAGMLADEKNRPEVGPEEVRAAKAETFNLVSEGRLRELDLHKKLVMLSIARSIRRGAYTTTGDVEKNYAVVCEEYGESQRGHTQFWKYIKELDGLGLIEAKRSHEGVGTTTKVSLPDLPAGVLEEKMAALLRRKK